MSQDASSKSEDPKAELFKDDDDEFEEFEAFNQDASAGQEEKSDLNVWEDNWDDESAETDFSKQLKEELAKHGLKPSQ